MGLDYLNRPGMDTQKTQFRSSIRKQFYKCCHFYNPKYIDPAFDCSLKNKRQGYCCVPPKVRPWIDFRRLSLTWQKQTGFSHFEQPSMQSVWHGHACNIIYHRSTIKVNSQSVQAIFALLDSIKHADEVQALMHLMYSSSHCSVQTRLKSQSLGNDDCVIFELFWYLRTVRINQKGWWCPCNLQNRTKNYV